ncbi:phosphatase PAP2 family protein [Latilactobacillus sp. 5-91]|uniref:phosphatase PAP2 family protein n=1 Tax=Latilactobacillus sp. 5-91 TaxID=3410924 RepID=UPI003C71917E
MSHQKQQLTSVIVGFSLFTIILVGLLNHAAWINIVDSTISQMVRSVASPLTTTLAVAVTSIGNPYSMLGLTVVATLTLLFIRQTNAALFLLVNMAVFSSLNHIIKEWVARPRPNAHHLVVANGFSFPSGHSSGALLFFGSLSIIATYLIKKRYWRYLLISVCLIFTLLIGVSRIYVQVHYPTDVFAGFMLALIGLGLSWYYFDSYHLLQRKS